MELYDFGDGIFRTHVTWEELEVRFKKLFGDNARLGENKKVTNIGDGRGFLSKMCLLEPDFPEDVNAPKKFVVKICSQVTMLEANDKMKEQNMEFSFADPKMMEMLTASVKKVHNTEVSLYELFDKYKSEHLPIAKVYFSQKFTEENPSKGYLIMEYIEDTVNINIYDNVSAEDLKQAMRGLAAMEAVSLSFTEEEKEFLNINPFTELFAQAFSPESTKSMVDMFRKFAATELGDRIDHFETILPELLKMDEFTRIGDDLSMPKILTHGDVWSTNILWRKGDNGKLTLAAIVDFQTAHLGMPAVDLVRVMGACLQGKERQEKWEDLVETFYEYFLEELNGRAAPYTVEQLKESCRRFFPLGGFMLVPMIGPLFEMNNNNPDEELRIRVTEVAMEKSRCLLEDIFENHERNLKLKEN